MVSSFMRQRASFPLISLSPSVSSFMRQHGVSTREVISLPADKVVEYSRSDWEEKVRNATLSWSASQHLIHLRFVEIALFRGHPDLP